VLSQPSNTWTGEKGRLSSDQIKNIFKQLNIQLDHSSFFVCGPKGMMDTVGATLDHLNVDVKNRFKESFYGSDSRKKVTNKEQSKKETISESKVKILLDNEEHDIIVKSDEFILETALDADLNMPFSCQGGVCTSCRAKLISGKVFMEDPEGLSDEEIEDGYILTCVSHPVSKDIKIEMG
jgi:ring-1,2-phenylacetyl-CoA epoxidase subunit PaaE